MSLFARSCSRGRRSARRTLRIESLERREVLAGNVAAQLVGSTLTLTGDALANQLMVSSVAGGRFAVIGGGTTINGSQDSFVTSRPVTSIVANFGGGDDLVGFGNDAQVFARQLGFFGYTDPFDVASVQAAIDAVAAGATVFTLRGNLAVTTGDGADGVGIFGTIGGSVAASLGSAPPVEGVYNGFMIGDWVDPFVSRVAGGVSIVDGAQNCRVFLWNAAVAGDAAANLGNGENVFILDGSSVGSLTFVGGNGADDVFTRDLRVRGGVSIATGGGNDQVDLGSNTGSQLYRTTVGGSAVVDTGAGRDFINAVCNVSGSLSLATGEGSDFVLFGDSTVRRNVTIGTGVGDDNVGISNTGIGGTLVVDLGAGNDGCAIGSTTALAAYLYGGLGTNILAIDASSRTGIRRLCYTQFQQVVPIPS